MSTTQPDYPFLGDSLADRRGPILGFLEESGESDESRCPVCGNSMSFCQGHGEIGDPAGHAILESHDAGFHDGCHEDVCDVWDGHVSITDLSDDDLDDAIQSFYEWVDGDEENGPRNPRPEDSEYINQLQDERQRRRREAEEARNQLEAQLRRCDRCGHDHVDGISFQCTVAGCSCDGYCGVCGEPFELNPHEDPLCDGQMLPPQEVAEFVNVHHQEEPHVLAHVDCGFGQNWPMA